MELEDPKDKSLNPPSFTPDVDIDILPSDFL